MALGDQDDARTPTSAAQLPAQVNAEVSLTDPDPDPFSLAT